MTVLWNGRGCAGGMFRGGYAALMGGRDGVLRAHLDFPRHSSDDSGLLKYFVLY